MQQFSEFGDERNKGWCVFCGGLDETRDHAPSKVFLDEPYPENLPVVPACNRCNNSFSRDEEYLACLIECAKTGSVELSQSPRSKVVAILERKPQLKSRIAAARVETENGILWTPEENRVRNVIVKLAKAHIAYEQNEPQLDEPTRVLFMPLCAMSLTVRKTFETSFGSQLWPEVESRAFYRACLGTNDGYPWIEVQQDQYRYLVDSGQCFVRLVIGEYLAAEVVWD